jgi:hypothetical protein
MTGSDRPAPTADAQGGDVDALLLSELRDLYIAGDPMPPDLVDHVLFSVTLADLELEVCRLTELAPLETAGARGTEEQTVRATFDSDPLTIMVEWTALGPTAVRIDGWLAPPGPHRVEVRTAGRTLTTTADVGGRFALDQVPRGLAQIVVRAVEPSPASVRTVVTPSFTL